MAKIQPFSLYYYDRLMNSFLNPPNYESTILEPRATLFQTTADVRINSLKEKISFMHTMGKPLRWIARAVVWQAIAALAAPAGTLYHGGQYLKYSFVLKDANKSSQHLKCLKADLLMAAIFYGTVYYFFKFHRLFIHELPANVRAVFQSRNITDLGSLFYSSILFFPYTFSLMPVISEGLAINNMTERDDKNRAPHLLSRLLRDELGLMTKEGQTLPYSNKDEDIDGIFMPDFLDMKTASKRVRSQKGYQFHMTICARFKIQLAHKFYELQGRCLAEELIDDKELHSWGDFKSIPHIIQKLLSSPKKQATATLIEEFQKLQRQADTVDSIFSDVGEVLFNVYDGGDHSAFSLQRKNFRNPYYLMQAAGFKPQDFNSLSAGNTDSGDSISYEDAQKELCQIQAPSSEYEDFRKKIQKNASIQELFDFPQDAAKLKSSFKTLAPKIAPDKITNPELKKEAEALYKCLLQAYGLLNAKFKKVET